MWNGGRGGGQVVSMLAFNSDDPSLNPLTSTIFTVNIVIEKNENKQKEAGVGPFKKTPMQLPLALLTFSYLGYGCMKPYIRAQLHGRTTDSWGEASIQSDYTKNSSRNHFNNPDKFFLEACY